MRIGSAGTGSKSPLKLCWMSMVVGMDARNIFNASLAIKTTSEGIFSLSDLKMTACIKDETRKGIG